MLRFGKAINSDRAGAKCAHCLKPIEKGEKIRIERSKHFPCHDGCIDVMKAEDEAAETGGDVAGVLRELVDVMKGIQGINSESPGATPPYSIPTAEGYNSLDTRLGELAVLRACIAQLRTDLRTMQSMTSAWDRRIQALEQYQGIEE